MNVLLVEHATSFGVERVSQGILTEGFSLLRLLCRDFTRSGDSVHVALHPSLGEYEAYLEYDVLHVVEPSTGFPGFLDSFDDVFDKSYVLAPDDVLPDYVRAMDNAGLVHLNSSAGACQIAGDKGKTNEILFKENIPTPQQVNPDSVIPFIAKPVSGTGCDNTHLIKPSNNASIISSLEGILCQEYVDGVHASVILSGDGAGFKPVCLNEQVITISQEGVLCYEGGFTPLAHELKRASFKLAVKCCNLIPGLSGLIGVDFVLSDKPYVIEVNPRLVTSALGLSRISKVNIADLIKGKAAGKPDFTGVSFYTHIKPTKYSKPYKIAPCDFMAIKGVWSPPIIPTDSSGNQESHGFALVWGETRDKALESYKSLKETIKGEVK